MVWNGETKHQGDGDAISCANFSGLLFPELFLVFTHPVLL